MLNQETGQKVIHESALFYEQPVNNLCKSATDAGQHASYTPPAPPRKTNRSGHPAKQSTGFYPSGSQQYTDATDAADHHGSENQQRLSVKSVSSVFCFISLRLTPVHLLSAADETVACLALSFMLSPAFGPAPGDPEELNSKQPENHPSLFPFLTLFNTTF